MARAAFDHRVKRLNPNRDGRFLSFDEIPEAMQREEIAAMEAALAAVPRAPELQAAVERDALPRRLREIASMDALIHTLPWPLIKGLATEAADALDALRAPVVGEPDKRMTIEEYAAWNIQGWHMVRREEGGFVDVRYGAPVGLPSEEEVNLAAQAACAAFYSDDPIPPNTIVSPVWDGLSTRARGNWRRAARAILARLAGRESEGWRPEVRAFAELMEQKLRENDHKGGWKKELPSLDLLPRLREETEELDDAISHWGAQVNWGKAALYLPGCIERVGREAADVANFAMMIADVCGALAPALASPADSAEEEGR